MSVESVGETEVPTWWHVFFTSSSSPASTRSSSASMVGGNGGSLSRVLDSITSRLLSSNDDDANNTTETDQLVNTFYINLIIFVSLMALFEMIRHMKSIYMNRLTRKFIKTQRVPPKPAIYPFAWIWSIFKVSEDDVLRMIGLDGYMLLRYLLVCFRIACFYAFWGLIVMVPVYTSGNNDLNGWNRYTIANLPDDSSKNAQALWTPVVFCYLFVIFFCQVMYFEYKNFIHKRVQYLVDGDLDTQVQTYYTTMIEHIPSSIRSTPILADFFERLFPGQVYSVEIALDLNELEDLTNHRRKVRNKLEKYIAIWKASSQRPNVWVKQDFYKGLDQAPKPIEDQGWSSWFGYQVYDAIDHYSKLLEILNENVEHMQKEYFQQRQKLDLIDRNRLREIRKTLAIRALETGAKQVRTIISDNVVSRKVKSIILSGDVEAQFDYDKGEGISENVPNTISEKEERKTASSYNEGDEITNPLTSDALLDDQGVAKGEKSITSRDESTITENSEKLKATDRTSRDSNQGIFQRLGFQSSEDNSSSRRVKAKAVLDMGAKMVGSGVEGIAKEGLKTAEYATKGALRGVLEATRALELLTVGAYYRISSTAFVTFKSRVANCSCQQMLLSHDYYIMEVFPAPNPKDIIWENVSIPQQQIKMRRSISDGTLMVGAIFWSIVVAFISAISNLESISQEIPALQEYSNTQVYKFFNNYLAILVLLILLSLLPFVFDFISRSYEGLKLESEIQNSIMTRYFYYQLANVFVAVGLGSIANSLHQILQSPSSILSILGNSVPSFSIYFANLIITRTFTGIPVEMLRIFPLLDILAVKMCSDKKKCTRRELRNGAFADPPMLYGWIYPNILMVLMIMVTYCCIAPMIMPLCAVFFALLYLMYKYQLLYVYINAYQSGGYMWYAVFDRSMLALMCGVITLVCYLAIRQTYLSGPFYAMFPLPIIIGLFWRHCNGKFKGPARNLSLERAIEIDRAVTERARNNQTTPHETFKRTLFRQPSLAEGKLFPAPYRLGEDSPSVPSNDLESGSNGERRSNSTSRQSCLDRDYEREYLHKFDEDDHDYLYRSSGHSNNSEEVEEEVNAFLEDRESRFDKNSTSGKLEEHDPIIDEQQETLSYGSIEKNRTRDSAVEMQSY